MLILNLKMFEVDNGRESKLIKVLISVEVAKQV
jgi:hypothetical protein